MLEVLISLCIVVVVFNWLLVLNILIIYFVFLLLLIYDGNSYLLSMIFILLSIWLIIMMMMCVDDDIKSNELLLIFIFLLIMLYLVFFSESLMVFYMSFEMSVIPILLIIFGWGYQPDRIEAGFYMLSYTVFFSLPLLVGIFYMEEMESLNSMIMCLMFLLAFLAKFPMFGLHLWLPRAHVEAPIFGSMVLAGVMLKLGGFGFIKVSMILGDYFMKFTNLLIILSILGGVLLSGVCFIQSDVKMLVAYSSVVHMSIVISGLLTFSEIGLEGGVFIMIGHGFCSSGLFCILGMTYSRTLTRSMFLNKGFISIIPSCSLWWFLFCSSNLAFPPCLNLPGELFLFISILSWSKNLFLLMGLLGLLSAMYSIYLFSFSQQGVCFKFFSFKNLSLKESMILMLHWIPLNIFILDLSVLTV
uniref:NADH-ubiquinone oxidoreductase chain 4 n=1 Tax=Freysuila caesalpiniae TaxID=2008487 RepID=A0A344A2C6_9HEMI|nr:NADH dehydrogenase subunit 4 [Freysuila caesalpiniae]AWU48917.1 NADH dehydrogenase subunit 4 [Freysuila caesalpiniae]